MKKGFTLIELMIVVAVIVTLMSMVFRLTAIGSGTTARNTTVVRLQRLENCLSGYYAAFGSYPPVAMHGTRNINSVVSGHGIQSTDEVCSDSEVWSQGEDTAWLHVNAACRCQPVDVAFPYPPDYQTTIAEVSQALQEKANGDSELYAEYQTTYRKKILTAGFDDAYADNVNRFSDHVNDVNWSDFQLFKFGLLSYLLPRYLVMMNGNEDFFTSYAQWKGNNELPADPLTGETFSSWNNFYQAVDDATGSSATRQNYVRIANIPSQAVTARWMPNLEGICGGEHSWSLYGVNIIGENTGNLSEDNPYINVYRANDSGETPDNENDRYDNQYVLDSITILDGWANALYYYSPPPYQNYVIWSAGENCKTFPPWIPLDSPSLTTEARKYATRWLADDITNMSN